MRDIFTSLTFLWVEMYLVALHLLEKLVLFFYKD